MSAQFGAGAPAALGSGSACYIAQAQYYNQAFVGFHAGTAAVYAITLFVLMLVLTIVQLRYVERRVTYG